MSDEIDARKVAVDERRLDFEIRKYDDDHEMRRLAVEKAREDLAKVREDIETARRPFFRNPLYLTPLATICVALLGGFFAFGTNAFNSKITELRSTKDSLDKQVKDLAVKQTEAEAANKKLGDQDQELQGNITTANGKISDLNVEIGKLDKQRADLSAQLPLQRINGLLSVLLTKARTDAIQPGDPNFQEALDTLRRAPLGSQVIKQVIDAHDDPQTPLTLKPALSSMLYKVTKAPRWKELLRKEALAEVQVAILPGTRLRVDGGYGDTVPVGRGLPYFSDYLEDKSIFSPEQRAANIRTLYETFPALPFQDGEPVFGRKMFDEYILREDEESLTFFREPWIAAYRHQRWTNNAGISIEGYAVAAIRAVVDTPPGTQASFPTNSTFFAKCLFPPDVPICTDTANAKTYFEQVPVPDDRRPFYSQWAKKNEQLISLFLPAHDDYSRMRALPNDVFADIVKNAWVTNDRAR